MKTVLMKQQHQVCACYNGHVYIIMELGANIIINAIYKIVYYIKQGLCNRGELLIYIYADSC